MSAPTSPGSKGQLKRKAAIAVREEAQGRLKVHNERLLLRQQSALQTSEKLIAWVMIFVAMSNVFV